MESSLTLIALPLALATIMLGLGLHLTVGDFVRIARRPKPVIVALACQLLLLPLICFGLVLAFGLPPVLAVGMMLLAASPGGTTASIYSHLFRGDVALNISLTGLNSVIALITLPLVVNFAIGWFMPGAQEVGMQFRKTFEVFLIVLVPVVIGMAIRRAKPDWAARMDRPVRIASTLILAVVIAGAVAANWAVLRENLGQLLGITVTFCALSLLIGYWVPQLLNLTRPQAIASAFEVGLHNATLAIVIAQSVMLSTDMSLPGAVYGVIMFPMAALFGFIVRRSAPVAAAA